MAIRPGRAVEGADNYASLKSLRWQLHVYGTAAARLRAFAVGVGLPVHEWAWTAVVRGAGLARGALYLVRPDGHVGFARQAQDIGGCKPT